MESVGQVTDGGFDFPLTQAELAETLGMSHVHVNRMVQQLRESGLIAWSGKKLTILDRERLMEFAGFEPNYLHLRRRGAGRGSAVGM